jgi:hypothetical protein
MQHTTPPCSDTVRRARDGWQLFRGQLPFPVENSPMTPCRKAIPLGTPFGTSRSPFAVPGLHLSGRRVCQDLGNETILGAGDYVFLRICETKALKD